MSLIKESQVVLITGTSSNLGVNIAYRVLERVKPDEPVTLIVTSRTLPKVKEVIQQINEYFKSKYPERIGLLEFDYLLVDFSDMISLLSAYYDLSKRYKKIDYLFINAAQGTYDGIDWPQAFKEVLTRPIEGVTNPTYKKQKIGVKSADGLGLVFQANVFGPYYFIHKIKHLLKGGKVVWISSLTGTPNKLSFEDLQLLKSPESYEGSKRLVDLMHMGSYKRLALENGIRQYLVQPGIFTSFSFFQFLNVFTYYGMLLLFVIARMLGSVNHNISGYTAANAPIVAAFEDRDPKYKYGSASNRLGEESIIVGEVDATGAEDVAAYLESLVQKWDEILKDQIVDSRKI